MLTSLITLTAVLGATACFKMSPKAEKNENKNPLQFATLLRDPSSLNHDRTYAELSSSKYLAFKKKMNSFSAKVSEAHARRNFETNNNIVISPLSIELCLGLAVSGANGQTREEILTALDVDYETFKEYYKLYFDDMLFESHTNTGDIRGQLLINNSIWIDDEVTLLETGLDDLRDNYYSYSYNVDFNNNNKKTNAAIREFVKEKTKGLIDKNFQISEDTLFTLMNTLYLKDIWNERGSNLPYASDEYKFTNNDGSVSNKQLLKGNYVKLGVLETEDFYAASSLGRSTIRLHFVKAKDGKSIKDVFKKDTIETVLDFSNYRTVDDEKKERYYSNCIFPEYEVEEEIDLIQMFKEEFNIRSLFNLDCDFSNLSSGQVYCNDFKQVAKISVDKKGIEGAAVTMMDYCGAEGPDEYEEIYESLVLDKEFGFVVTKGFNDIIFTGIVTNID